MRKFKILVIDDEPIIHDIVSFMVKSRGYKVMSSPNGEDGLAKARDESPDLILLDIMMPGMRGHDVCMRLKSDRDTKRIPIVMITGESDRNAILKAREIGADDYIVKPFTLATLTERMDKYLGKSKDSGIVRQNWLQKLFRRRKKY